LHLIIALFMAIICFNASQYCKNRVFPVQWRGKEEKMDFFAKLESRVQSLNTNLCVGLDPSFSQDEISRLGSEACMRSALERNLTIIEKTAPFTACYKPNIAFYEAFGSLGLEVLKKTIDAIPKEIPVLLDAKRGDIGSTAKAYAQAVFGYLGADAVTLNPYMGKDTVEPFLEWDDKGVFILCRTSNPGAPLIEELPVDGKPLYLKVAQEFASWSPRVGLVVAGNDPASLKAVRDVAPSVWILAPGIGAQGGKADEAMRAGSRADGSGILVVAARSVAEASDPGEAARVLRDTMRQTVSIRDPVADPLKQELIKYLIETGCFKLGEFTLKSGIKSPFYIDLRKLISNPAAMRAAGKAYARLASQLVYARIAGIPSAGLPLATAASLSTDKPMIWPRMPVKEHGTGNRIEGSFERGEIVLLLDDLITTGLSKLEAIDILRAEGLEVMDLVVLIERGREGRADMEKAGVQLHAFLQVGELFDYCEQNGIIDSAKKHELEDFAGLKA